MPPKKDGITWQWQDDTNAFVDFNAATTKKVEDGYVAAGGAGKAMLTYNGSKYEVDFDAMTQRNTESNKVRHLRRQVPLTAAAAVAAGAPAPAPAPAPAAAPVVHPPVTWTWKNDHGAQQPYVPDKNAEIEASYQQTAKLGGHTSTVILGTQMYTLDFHKMQQTNDKSGFSRAISRAGGDPATDQTATIAGNASKHGAKSAATAHTVGEPSAKKSHAEVPMTAAYKSEEATKSYGSGGTKVVQKGRGVVDPHSGMAKDCHIYEEGKVVWQCMLNQTNIGNANNNKFYVIQLLESDTAKKYWVFTRWGRVGAVGQSALDSAYSMEGAKAQFCSKFRDKTKNDWSVVSTDKEKFTKHPGKYQLMDIDLGGGGDDDDAVDHVTNASSVGSALPPSLQKLMRMIGSKGDMTKAMKELEIDTNKMPLGKISKKQIKDAFMLLKKIETELKKPKPDQSAINDDSGMFYTLIPHDFGMSKLPAIRDMDHLKRKMDLLEMLSDLEVASKLLSEGKKLGKHPLDASYEALKCSLVPLDKSSAEFKRIERMVANTHGATHHLKVHIEDVFTVERAGETTRYEANYGKLHNKQMLWHGSRTTNFMGILSQGLRIAPPEAPSTGYMFGKGVYFADCVTKSANYCHSSTDGVLLLCESALGNMLTCTGAKYMDKPQAGTQSTWGAGRNVPDPAGHEVDADGVTYPCGKLVPGPHQSSTLLYNEFIVYDVSQLRMRYLLVCKFGKK